MSDLQDALDRASVGLSEDGYPVISGGTSRQLKLLMEAARLVANPNYMAAYAAMMDAIEWRGVPDKHVAKAAVAAALTPPEDTP